MIQKFLSARVNTLGHDARLDSGIVLIVGSKQPFVNHALAEAEKRMMKGLWIRLRVHADVITRVFTTPFVLQNVWKLLKVEVEDNRPVAEGNMSRLIPECARRTSL